MHAMYPAFVKSFCKVEIINLIIFLLLFYYRLYYKHDNSLSEK